MIALLFTLTFLESVAATLIQRGLYFYTHETLGFSESRNLWLAFGFGVAYVVGAFFSHRITHQLGERRVLTSCIVGLLGLHTLLALFPTPWVLVSCVLGTAAIQGIKWPVVESYVSAGRAPRELLPVLSRYNVTWATAGFVAVGITGLILGSGIPPLFFWFPALLNLLGLLLCRRLPAKPQHLDHQHPERPDEGGLVRMRALLGAARWSMTGSYALLYVLAPLMPTLLAKLSLPVTLATPVASILDATRVVTFGALGAFAGWHGKRLPLWFTLAALPGGFLLVLLGGSLPLVILGEVLFGVGAGFAYTASLYYALVAENASVDAGGAHESLIGVGIGLGPLSGLAGQLLVGASLPGLVTPLGPFLALAFTTAPIIGLCALGSVRSLFRLPGHHE